MFSDDVGLHLAMGLHPGEAMPKLLIFNFGEGAFARGDLGAPLVPTGFCVLTANVALVIQDGLPARKRG